MSITINQLFNVITNNLTGPQGIDIKSKPITQHNNPQKFIQYHNLNTKYPKSLRFMIHSGYRSHLTNPKYIQESFHGEIRIFKNDVYNCLHFEGPMNVMGHDLQNIFLPLEKALQNKGYFNGKNMRIVKYQTRNHTGGMLFEIKCFSKNNQLTTDEELNTLKSSFDVLFECLESVLP